MRTDCCYDDEKVNIQTEIIDVKKIAEDYGQKAAPRMIVAALMRSFGRDRYGASGDEEMRMYWDARAGRMEDCGSYAVRDEYADGRAARMSAMYCRDRLCPACGWRRSLRAVVELRQCMELIKNRGKRYRWLFLTLTATDVSGDKLPGVIDHLLKSWNLFQRKPKFRAAVKGWMRLLDVTYSAIRGDYHPHIYALLMVPRGYFNGKSYVRYDEWRRMWRDAAHLDYDPQVTVRPVKEDDENEQLSAREIVKNSLNGGMMAAALQHSEGNVEDPMNMVAVLDSALAGRMLYAYGGLLRETRRELRYKDDDADLGQDISLEIPDSVMDLH